MRTRLLVGTAAGVMLVAGAVPAHAADGDAQLSVLHGVPGLTVDVYVNGDLTLDDFEPAIGPIDLTLEDGMNYTAAAHLDAEGTPTASLFTNDISNTAAGEGRLTVRHAAAAPAVDILAGGDAVIEGLENPDEEVLNLPAGSVPAAVAAAGTTEPVVGPTDVNVAEGVNTIVYAWGSLEDDNLALAVQTIEGLHSAPEGVPSGELGLAAESGPNALLLIGGVAAAGLGALAVMRRKATATR